LDGLDGALEEVIGKLLHLGAGERLRSLVACRIMSKLRSNTAGTKRRAKAPTLTSLTPPS
jgi:hypothetical protein